MNMLITAHTYASEGLLFARSKASRHVHSNVVLKRTIKHREERAWREEVLAPDDTEAAQAYEDSERILDYLSTMWWHGYDRNTELDSMLSFTTCVHNQMFTFLVFEEYIAWWSAQEAWNELTEWDDPALVG